MESNPDVPWSDAQVRTLRITTCVLAFPSVLGTAFLVVSGLLFPVFRTYPARLMLYLAFATFLTCLMALISGIVGQDHLFHDTTLCQAQAFILIFGVQAEYVWFAVICFNLHRTLSLGKLDGARFEPFMHIIAWGSSLVMALVLYFTTEFGPSGPWCQVSIDAESTTLRDLIGSYLPPILIWIYAVIMLILVAKSTRTILKRYKDAVMKSQKRLLVFALIYAIAVPFGIASRLELYLVGEGGPTFGLTYVHVFAVSAEGILMFFLFGCSKTMYQQWKGLIGRLLLRRNEYVRTSQQSSREPTATSRGEQNNSSGSNGGGRSSVDERSALLGAAAREQRREQYREDVDGIIASGMSASAGLSAEDAETERRKALSRAFSERRQVLLEDQEDPFGVVIASAAKEEQQGAGVTWAGSARTQRSFGGIDAEDAISLK